MLPPSKSTVDYKRAPIFRSFRPDIRLAIRIPRKGSLTRPTHWETTNYINISIQQSGRKTLTTLQGLPKQYDAGTLLKTFEKAFATKGTLVNGNVIQLQGDQRTKINAYLIEHGIDRATIKMHGF